MKKLTETEQKMFDWDNELRFYSTEYSDEKVIEVAQKAIDFAYANFKEKETVFEGFDFQYESHIENIALGIDSHLQKSPKNKKSKLIQNFVLSVINTEKYGSGRSGFIYLIYILKMDLELKKIARERLDFWKQPRVCFQLLYAVYRRKIEEFKKEAEMLMQYYPKETEFKKYANKYLEQQSKMQNINKLKTSYSPWDFNFCDEIDGFKIEYKNITEFVQGSPLIGNLYVNNKELLKDKFFSSPYLYFERYLYIPMFIKHFCLSGFIMTKINLDTLEIHYISKIESLIYIDCIYDNRLMYYTDVNKEEKKEILL